MPVVAVVLSPANPFQHPVMIVVLSPAKTFTIDKAAAAAAGATPRFAAAADALAAKLALPAPKLASLLGVSAALGALNADRYAAWGSKDSPRVAAGLAMDGPAFKAMNLRSATDKQKASAAKRVRILSGLYGLLSPYDAVQPYRLEMGTKLKNLPGAPADTLYDHWQGKLAAELEKDAGGAKPIIVNAASQEYWSAVAGKFSPSTRIVECKFPGPAVYAKAARGAIARFIVDHELDAPDRLREFTGIAGEWAFDAGASKGDTYVFKRVAGGAAKAPAAKKARKA